MARENRPVLGQVSCSGCGGSATVHQTARGAGRYLYTRCPDCGVDQRTGAHIQTRLFYSTEWRDGPPEAVPPNLIDPGQGSEPVKREAEAVQEAVDEPGSEPVEDAGEPGESGLFWLIGGVVTLAAVALRGGV